MCTHIAYIHIDITVIDIDRRLSLIVKKYILQQIVYSKQLFFMQQCQSFINVNLDDYLNQQGHEYG